MRNFLAKLIATWFYTGLIPPIILKGMAGTYGTFFSLPLCYFIISINDTTVRAVTFIMTILLITVAGTWSVKRAEIILGPRTDWKGKTKTHDQNQIVIDETYGLLITCTPLILSDTVHHIFWSLGLAFCLFRLFDIIKVPPTNWFDNIKTPFGVMLDDLMAGIYAALCLALCLIFFRL